MASLNLRNVLERRLTYQEVDDNFTNLNNEIATKQNASYTPVISGAIERTIEDKILESVSVMDFGAVGDGVTDDSSAFQSAVDYCESSDTRVIRVPSASYVISSTITVNRAVSFYGENFSDYTNSTNGSGSTETRPTIKWTGPAGGTMFRYLPDSSGYIVFGGAFEKIHLDGNTLAGIGLLLDNCRFTEVFLHGRRFREALLKVTSESGLSGQQSQKVVIKELRYVYGISSETDVLNGCGCIIEGVSTTITQVFGYMIDGLVYNGDLLRITQHDNGQFYYVRGSVQAGGTGRTLSITNTSGSGVQDGCQNTFYHLVGPVNLGANTINTRILNYNSESAAMTGTGHWHGNVEDYITGEMFITHEYRLIDRWSLSATDFGNIYTATSGVASSAWPCWNMFDSGTSRIGVLKAPPFSWSKGRITGIRIWASMDTNNVSKSVFLRFRVATYGTGSNSATPETDETSTYSVNDSQFVINRFDFTLSSPLSYTKGDMIGISLYREATDVADTAAGNLQILGAEVLFESTGPNRSTTQYFTIPSPAAAGY